MLEPHRRSGGLRRPHGALLVGAVVVVGIAAYFLVAAVVGIVFKLIELAVVVAILAGAVHYLRRYRRK